MKKIDAFICSTLSLEPGDIIIYEDLYDDANEGDFFPFSAGGDFFPSHTAMIISGDKPLVHSVRLGYRLPGLRVTNLQQGRAHVFRMKNNEIAQKASELLTYWALLTQLHTRKTYENTYPKRYWNTRYDQDIKNFFFKSSSKVSGPLIPFPEPRATNDLYTLARDRNIKNMGSEGLRRSIKFASRTEMSSEQLITKGQRCTPMIIAALQASYLEPIVEKSSKKRSFKHFKNCLPKNYLNNVLIKSWEDTQLGKEITKAVDSNDYSRLFPQEINIDQRFVTPKMFFQRLIASDNIESIGQFSLFNDKAFVIKTDGTTHQEGISDTRERP